MKPGDKMNARADRSPYSIHHELMNQVALMSGYSYLLAEDLPADQLEMIEQVRKAAQEANRLGRELRDALDLRPPASRGSGEDADHESH